MGTGARVGSVNGFGAQVPGVGQSVGVGMGEGVSVGTGVQVGAAAGRTEVDVEVGDGSMGVGDGVLGGVGDVRLWALATLSNDMLALLHPVTRLTSPRVASALLVHQRLVVWFAGVCFEFLRLEWYRKFIMIYLLTIL